MIDNYSTTALLGMRLNFWVKAILVTAFVALNVTVPILLHSFNLGQVFLPIYAFTLIGALTLGWPAGLMIGLLSPTISYLYSGMPPWPILGFVLIKSIILALVAGLLVKNSVAKTMTSAFLAVAVAQLIGTALIWVLTGNPALAVADLRVGYPGLLLQAILIPALVSVFLPYGHKTL